MKWLDLPPVWLVAFLVAGRLQASWLPLLRFRAWADWAGAALVLAGLLLMIAAVWELRRHHTTIDPREPPSAIVTTGVFAWSRNPIYLGDTLVLAGLALWWDSVLGLFLVPVFVWVITRRFILKEEARLSELFGSEFADYSDRVRRWF